MGSKRVVRPGSDVFGPFGITLKHGGSRAPARADDLLHNRSPAAPRQFLGQRNTRGVELVDALVLGPEVQRAAVDIDQHGTVAQVGEIWLPVQRAEAGDIATH